MKEQNHVGFWLEVEMVINNVNENKIILIDNQSTFNHLRLTKLVKYNSNEELITLILTTQILNMRSKSYDEVAFSRQKARLFDFTSNISYQQLNQYLQINYHFTYLKELVNIDELTNFIHDIIENNYINKTLFDICKQAMLLELQSVYDNPQQHALNCTLSNNLQGVMSIDTMIQHLEKITIEQCVRVANDIVSARFNYEIQLNKDGNCINIIDVYDKCEKLVSYKLKSNENVFIDNNKEQANLYMVFELPTKYNKYQMQLFSNVFGQGADSLLFKIIREQEHLCYSIYSQVVDNQLLFIYVGLEPQQVDFAQERITQILEDMANKEHFFNLEQIKLQTINAIEKNQDNFNYVAKLIDKYFLYSDSYDISFITKQIHDINYKTIQQIASDVKFLNKTIVK